MTPTTIADALETTPVSSLDLGRFATVAPSDSVAETVRAMADSGFSAACVLDGRELAGIFTQRDYLHSVAGRPSVWERPVADVMTHSVRTITADDSVAAGLHIMVEWWTRSVPVLDSSGAFVGNVSFVAVMKLMTSLLADRVGLGTGEPSVGHGLAYVDFRGLNTSSPFAVAPSTPVGHAVHHMRARGIGSVLVEDQRNRLVGELTEFELLTGLGCRDLDLDSVPVSTLMNESPIALPIRSSIADAMQTLLDHEYSHVVLSGESGRPVGVASFRDIARFIETAIDSLA